MLGLSTALNKSKDLETFLVFQWFLYLDTTSFNIFYILVPLPTSFSSPLTWDFLTVNQS